MLGDSSGLSRSVLVGRASPDPLESKQVIDPQGVLAPSAFVVVWTCGLATMGRAPRWRPPKLRGGGPLDSC